MFSDGLKLLAGAATDTCFCNLAPRFAGMFAILLSKAPGGSQQCDLHARHQRTWLHHAHSSVDSGVFCAWCVQFVSSRCDGCSDAMAGAQGCTSMASKCLRVLFSVVFLPPPCVVLRAPCGHSVLSCRGAFGGRARCHAALQHLYAAAAGLHAAAALTRACAAPRLPELCASARTQVPPACACFDPLRPQVQPVILANLLTTALRASLRLVAVLRAVHRV